MRRRKNRSNPLSFIFLLVFCASIMCIAYFIASNPNYLYTDGQEVNATVTSIYDIHFEGDNVKHYPKFTYTINGEEYISMYHLSTDDAPFEVGDTAIIRIDNNDPERFTIPDDKPYPPAYHASIKAAIVSAILMILSFIPWRKLF